MNSRIIAFLSLALLAGCGQQGAQQGPTSAEVQSAVDAAKQAAVEAQQAAAKAEQAAQRASASAEQAGEANKKSEEIYNRSLGK